MLYYTQGGVDMKYIPLSNVIDIEKDKLHYRDDIGNVVCIELAPCAIIMNQLTLLKRKTS